MSETSPSTRQLWTDAVWASDLEPLERLVALVYAKYAGRGVSRVWVGPKQLLADTGLARSTAFKIRSQLVAAGWLVEVDPGRQHRSTVYALTDPTSSPAAGRPGHGPASSSPAPDASSPAPDAEQSGARTPTTTEPQQNHDVGEPDRLVDDVLRRRRAPSPSKARAALVREVASLLHEGMSSGQVRDGLELWNRKGFPASALAGFVDEADRVGLAHPRVYIEDGGGCVGWDHSNDCRCPNLVRERHGLPRAGVSGGVELSGTKQVPNATSDGQHGSTA